MITDKPNKFRIAVLVVLILAFAGLLVYVISARPATGASVRQLADHWTVTSAGQTMENVALADTQFGVVNAGDVFQLRNTLPEDEVFNAGLQIQTTHASIRVLVNGKQILEDGEQYLITGRMTPTRFHFVRLPAGYGGKELTIELTANENAAFSGLLPVYTGNIHELYMSYIGRYRITLVASLFLCVTGIIMLFVFFFLWNYYRLEIRMLFSALLAFFLGFYVLSYHELSDFINGAITVNDFFEYFSLSVLPFLFICFLGAIQEKEKRRIYFILAIINISVISAISTLHFFDVVHINRAIPVIHILILTEGTLVIAIALRNALGRRKSGEIGQRWQISDRVLLMCFFIMLVFALFDIVRYLLMRYLFAGGSTYPDLTFVLIGALVFVTGLFINFFYYHIERIGAERTTARLSGLAYTDPLTGMANRSRCEKLIDDLNDEEKEYTVVSMDVNYLKRINDTYGHSTGDKYLVDMASFIRAAFPDAALHGRMGGDEFIVIMEGTDPNLYRECVERLREAIRKKNETSTDIDYGISYGCAYTHETKGHTLQAALDIADARMYEMKRIRHAQEDAREKDAQAKSPDAGKEAADEK